MKVAAPLFSASPAPPLLPLRDNLCSSVAGTAHPSPSSSNPSFSPKSNHCHTYEEFARKSFACHTYKNKGLITPLFATHPKKQGVGGSLC